MHTRKIIEGTNGADMMSYKGSLYNNSSIFGLGGPDIIQLYDLFDVVAYGGNGNDAFLVQEGFNVTLDGGVGDDVYKVQNSAVGVIYDDNGSSGIVMDDVTGTSVTLGDGNDIVNLKGVSDSVFRLGFGFDEVISEKSGGGNKVAFEGDGRAILKYGGMNFIAPEKTDTIDVGGGRVEILVQVDLWNNSGGRAELDFKAFGDDDLIRFDWGATPDFVTFEEGNATATWFTETGNIFQVSANGVSWSVPGGVFSGNTVPGVGAGIGQPMHTFFALPNYYGGTCGEGGGFEGLGKG